MARTKKELVEDFGKILDYRKQNEEKDDEYWKMVNIFQGDMKKLDPFDKILLQTSVIQVWGEFD